MPPNRSRKLASIGAAVTVVGILMDYLLERISFADTTSSKTFRFLDASALPTAGLGLLLFLIGIVLVAVSSAPRTCSQLGSTFLGIDAVAALALFCYPNAINVHDWTGLLMFPLVLLLPLGLLLLVSSLIKTVRRENS